MDCQRRPHLMRYLPRVHTLVYTQTGFWYGRGEGGREGGERKTGGTEGNKVGGGAEIENRYKVILYLKTKQINHYFVSLVPGLWSRKPGDEATILYRLYLVSAFRSSWDFLFFVVFPLKRVGNGPSNLRPTAIKYNYSLTWRGVSLLFL